VPTPLRSQFKLPPESGPRTLIEAARRHQHQRRKFTTSLIVMLAAGGLVVGLLRGGDGHSTHQSTAPNAIAVPLMPTSQTPTFPLSSAQRADAVLASNAERAEAVLAAKAAASISTATSLGLHVAPATNLQDGEVVQVTISGFPPGEAYLSECAATTDVSALGCGAQLAAQPFVVIENGAGSGTFAVTHQAASTPLSPEPSTTCTNQCVLIATSGAPASGARHIQTVNLAFGP